MIFCVSVLCDGISIVTRFRLFQISAVVGLVLMSTRIAKKDIPRLLFLGFLNTGFALSVMKAGRMDRMIMILGQAYVACPYIYLYLTLRGLGRPTLVALALGTIPQLFVYLTGSTLGTGAAYIDGAYTSGGYTSGARFCGTASDPNFLCLNLVVVFGAQLALIRCSRSIPFRVLCMLAAVTTMFLITISLSRAGTIGMSLAVLIFGLSSCGRHRYGGLCVGVLMVCVFFTAARLVCEKYSPDSAVGILHNRFVEEGGSSVLTNDRYEVWNVALKQIVAGPPMMYNDGLKFVSDNGVAAHNMLVDLGLRFGWLPAFGHSVIWCAGVALLLLSSCREWFLKKRRQIRAILTQSSELLVILPFFVVSMSLPASGGFLYWVEFALVFTLGLFTTHVIPPEQSD